MLLLSFPTEMVAKLSQTLHVLYNVYVFGSVHKLAKKKKAVFILRCIIRLDELGQTFVVRLVMRLEYKDGHKTNYASRRTIYRPVHFPVS